MSNLITAEYPITRMQRLRADANLRRLVKESNLTVDDLIYPLFVADISGKEEIESMPGIYRFGIEAFIEECHSAASLKIPAIAIFPVVSQNLKTACAAEAYNPDGLVQRAIKELKSTGLNIITITDVALDPYTVSGQDGLLDDSGSIDNDATIEILTKQALSHAKVGADIIAPSDMMDGRIKHIRQELESNGFKKTNILSYAAKYASNFYGPFRQAIKSSNSATIDKSTYQLNSCNAHEALREVALDIKEGADIVMVKPALPYLDIISSIKREFQVPTFAYQVSGEYSMLTLAAKSNWGRERECILESLYCMKRAGADAILTYFAPKVASWLVE